MSSEKEIEIGKKCKEKNIMLQSSKQDVHGSVNRQSKNNVAIEDLQVAHQSVDGAQLMQNLLLDILRFMVLLSFL